MRLPLIKILEKPIAYNDLKKLTKCPVNYGILMQWNLSKPLEISVKK